MFMKYYMAFEDVTCMVNNKTFVEVIGGHLSWISEKVENDIYSGHEKMLYNMGVN